MRTPQSKRPGRQKPDPSQRGKGSVSPEYQCSHCNGTGKIPLTGIYADTLEILQHLTVEASGVDLAAIDGCKPTAMNNRLAALERMGFATSRRYGKVRLFKAANHTLHAEP